MDKQVLSVNLCPLRGKHQDEMQEIQEVNWGRHMWRKIQRAPGGCRKPSDLMQRRSLCKREKRNERKSYLSCSSKIILTKLTGNLWAKSPMRGFQSLPESHKPQEWACLKISVTLIHCGGATHRKHDIHTNTELDSEHSSWSHWWITLFTVGYLRTIVMAATIPTCGNAESVINLCCFFIRNCQTSAQSAHTILDTHHQSVKFPVAHIFTICGIVNPFNFSHSSEYVMVFHCSCN